MTAASALLSRCATPPPEVSSPSVFTSSRGLLSLDLTASISQVSLANRSAKLMTYNVQVPGPRLEAWAGDEVEIRLTNALAAPTNLHFHGLHISPTSNSDNPFLEVLPEESFTYRLAIPRNHPAGLFWYHPHYHGKVAEQVAGGLAGVFIVRGELDQIPEIAGAREEILVLQDFDLDRQGRVKEPMPVFRKWGRQGDLITVNGEHQPQVMIPPEGLLRLRLLNASASRYYRLQLQNHPWMLIATDGHALDVPREINDLLIAPGQRADFLIAGNQAEGEYDLISLPYDRGIQAMANSMGHPDTSSADGLEASKKIATLVYGYRAAQTPIPDRIVTVETLPEPDRVREFVFDHGIDAETGQPFLINGKAFKHHRVDTQVKVGTVEDWILINKAGMDHPFHLHTNPFQVISRNGEPETLRAWRDVVNIKAYETVRIRIPFRNYKGQTVYHCHILDHEDQGMMGIVEML